VRLALSVDERSIRRFHFPVRTPFADFVQKMGILYDGLAE